MTCTLLEEDVWWAVGYALHASESFVVPQPQTWECGTGVLREPRYCPGPQRALTAGAALISGSGGKSWQFIDGFKHLVLKAQEYRCVVAVTSMGGSHTH